MMKRRVFLLLSLIVVLAGAILASATQTAGGDVEIDDIRFAGDQANRVSGLLYVPEGVSPENPAPGIVATHGYINSRETQDGFAIEYARRGYVVLALDMAGHGFSEQVPDPTRGVISGLHYFQNLPFVDQENIGLEGHSMGGWSSVAAAHMEPDTVKSLLLVGSSTGLEPLGVPSIASDFPVNTGVIFSQYDEFSQLMWGVSKAQNVTESEKLMHLFGTDQPVEPGRMYGDLEAQTARMLYTPSTTHPGDHFSTEAIGMAMHWMDRTLEGAEPVPQGNQIWYWKEIGTFIALIGMVLFMFPWASTLLNRPFFESIRTSVPEGKGVKGTGWVIGALLATIIPAVTFYRFQHWGSDTLFPASALLPQNLTSGVMTWAVLNGLIGLVLFLLWHRSNKKQGGNGRRYGLKNADGKVETSLISKSLLLAFGINLGAYGLLLLSDWFFEIDFRLWVLAIKTFSPERFGMFWIYLLPFLFFFLVNSLILHGQFRLRTYGSRLKTFLVWSLANAGITVLGLTVLIVLNYIVLFSTGALMMPAEPLLTILGIQFIPLLTITSFLTTWLYMKTGTIYTGAFTNAIFITWVVVAGQAIQYAG